MLISMKSTLFFITSITYPWLFIESLSVIIQRANLSEYNSKYVKFGVFNVRRAGRRKPYVLNLYGQNLQEWNNNISVEIFFSEYLHNEYRRSFIEANYKFCDLINNEPFIGGMFKIAGVICPLPPGVHNYTNMTAPLDTFHNVFPFEKGRVDAIMTQTTTKEVVVHYYVECLFKN